MQCPCRYCDKRKVGCHVYCKEYKLFEEERVAVRKKIKLESLAERDSYIRYERYRKRRDRV